MGASPECANADISWFGEIPSEWASYKIKHLCKVNASNIGKNNTGNLECNVIHYNDVVKNDFISDETIITKQLLSGTEATAFLLKKDDMLLTKDSMDSRNIGDSVLIDCNTENLISGYHLYTLRSNLDLISSKFLKYCFDSYLLKQELLLLSRGTTIIGLSAQALCNVRIPVPVLNIQRAIVSYLNRETTRIDKLISEKQNFIKLLEEERQTFISHVVTKGLNDSVKMKDSGVGCVGLIPQHWKLPASKYIFKFVTSGSRGWADYYSDDGDIFFRITNLHRGKIEPKLASIKYVKPPKGAEGQRACINVGDILISITADLGSICVADDSIKSAYVSQHVALCRPNNKVFSPRWLGYFILSSAAKEQLLESGYGGTKQQLSLEDIKELTVCLPPPEEQILIANKLDIFTNKIDSLMENCTHSIELLKEHRSALISAAVTGKIDVREEV